MEFSFNINDLLKDEITTVDNNLQPCKRTGIDRYGFQRLQSMLYEIVDKMGAASAKAQGLHSSITSGKKLELAGHRHYIIKDGEANGGKGAAVGILKVGTKKLFVYDNAKVQHELDPLCVLDFYVHESRQRMGCGKKLFEFMLRREGILPQHLAIDRPSPKFSSFLRKHYRLCGTIPQVNNFVIFDGFFSNRNDLGGNRGRRRDLGVHTQSPIGTRLNSGGSRNSRLPPSPSPLGQGRRKTPLSELQNGSLQGIHSAVSSQQVHDGSMGAGEMMYSRHGPSPPHNGAWGRNSPGSVLYKKMNGLSSPHMYFNTGMNPTNFYPQSGEHHPQYPQHTSGLHNTPQAVASTPTHGTRMVEQTNPIANNVQMGMPLQDQRFSRNGSSLAQPLPDISSHPQSLPNGLVAHRPPSGKQTSYNKTDSTNPPLVPRGPPPKEYTDMLNMHQAYQNRNGRLTVAQSSSPLSLGPDPSIEKGSPSNHNTSWTVTGVLREQRMNGRYNSTRLW